MAAVVMVLLGLLWAVKGRERRKERKRYVAAKRESRQHLRREHRDRLRAIGSGSNEYKQKEQSTEPSDLEKIISKLWA